MSLNILTVFNYKINRAFNQETKYSIWQKDYIKMLVLNQIPYYVTTLID